MGKVCIIGLDGCTWKIIKPMMDNGAMPVLKRLMENSASGNLKSTVPPVTAPAWVSFQTGVNPGKHGILDFKSFNPNNKKINLVNSSNINIKTIWELASDAGKKIIAINVPVTYPPRPVNGIIVGDMLSPVVDENFVYPKEVYHRFISGSAYKISGARVDKLALASIESFIQEQIDVEEARFNLARKLMREYDWDLFMVHNQMMDIIQHAFYPYLDPSSGRYSKEKFMKISEFYKKTDEFIGDLIKDLDQDTTVMIISDHGSAEVNCYVNLNTWLFKNGHLRFTYMRLFADVLTALRKFKFLSNLIKKILIILMRRPTQIAEFSGKASSKFINWDKSKAFSANGSIWGNFYCNNKETTLKICKELERWHDPLNKRKIVKNIYRREEVFSGPYLNNLPEIFLEPNEGYAFCTPLIKSMRMFQRPSLSRYERVGTHDLNGILLVKGSNIIKNKYDIQADIIDLAPTILGILGLSVPQYMDGRVLNEIFAIQPAIHKDEKPMFCNNSIAKLYSQSDRKEIEKRLRELGYLE